jgi:carbon storage regulator
MLVLTRHRNEQIVLEEQIVVTVLDIDRRNGIVRLGITAPRNVPVNRLEVHERIRDGRAVDPLADPHPAYGNPEET